MGVNLEVFQRRPRFSFASEKLRLIVKVRQLARAREPLINIISLENNELPMREFLNEIVGRLPDAIEHVFVSGKCTDDSGFFDHKINRRRKGPRLRGRILSPRVKNCLKALPVVI